MGVNVGWMLCLSFTGNLANINCKFVCECVCVCVCTCTVCVCLHVYVDSEVGQNVEWVLYWLKNVASGHNIIISNLTVMMICLNSGCVYTCVCVCAYCVCVCVCV